MAHVHYVSDACFLFGMVQCSMFLKQVQLIFHEWTWFWLHYIDMCNEQNDDNVIIFQHDWICFNLTQFFMILIMMVMSTSSSILWKFSWCRSQDCLNLKKQLLLPDFSLFTPPTYAWLNSFVFFPPHLLALISCRRFIFERYDCMIFLVEVNQALIAWSFRLFHVFDNF